MIEGASARALDSIRDERGHLAELFRCDWVGLDSPPRVQWHILRSRAGALRGMHVHARHDDFKVVLEGRVTLALKDLRQGSPTEGQADVLRLEGDQYTGIPIPAGVAHGLLAETDSLVLVGVTALYDPSDDFECSWADPELGIAWPSEPTFLSERDRHAGPLRELLARLHPWQPLFPPGSAAPARSRSLEAAGHQ